MENEEKKAQLDLLLCHFSRLLFIFVYSAGLSALFTGLSAIHMDEL